ILYFVAPNLVGDTVEGMYHGTPGYRVTGGIFEDYGASALLSGLFFLTVMLFSPIRQRRLLAAIGYVISWLFLFLAKSRSVTFSPHYDFFPPRSEAQNALCIRHRSVRHPLLNLE